MPKFIVLPQDAQGKPIERAKSSVELPDGAKPEHHPDVRNKVMAQVKRAGTRCEKVTVASEEAGLKLVYDRDAHLLAEAKPGKSKREYTGSKKSGPNSKSRKAHLRQMYQDGASREDALAWATKNGLMPTTFKTCWTEFKRYRYPRKGNLAA